MRHKRNRTALTVAIVCLLFGILYVVEGRAMDGSAELTRGALGPGALPGIMGAAMIVAAIAYFVQEWRAGGRAESEPETASPVSEADGRDARAPWWRSHRLRRSPWLMLGLVTIYLLLLPWVGFFTLTAILMVLLLSVVGVLTWPSRGLLTVVFLGLGYLLFARLLDMTFPAGYAGL